MDKKSKLQIKYLDKKLILLLEDLKSYSDTKLNEQPNPASWSVLQIIQHLMKAEGVSLNYIQKKLSYNPELKKANVLSNMRSKLLNLSLAIPFKVKAPENISDEHLATNLTFWEVAKEWKYQREQMKSYLASLPAEIFQKELYKHPLTGRMKISGMLSFFNKHFDRHLHQIRRTLKKIDAVKQL